MSIELLLTTAPNDACIDFTFQVVDTDSQKLKFTDSATPTYTWGDKEIELQLKGSIYFITQDTYKVIDYKLFKS